MAYNEISKAATNKYRAKFSMIQIRVQQEDRDRIAEQTMERDNAKSGSE